MTAAAAGSEAAAAEAAAAAATLLVVHTQLDKSCFAACCFVVYASNLNKISDLN